MSEKTLLSRFQLEFLIQIETVNIPVLILNVKISFSDFLEIQAYSAVKT